MRHAVLLLLIFPLTTFAAPDPNACTYENLTNNCQFFKDGRGKKEFEFADGTKIANPFYFEFPGVNAGTPTIKLEDGMKSMQRSLRIQAKLSKALEGSVSDEFRVSLASPTTIMTLMNIKQNEKQGSSGGGRYMGGGGIGIGVVNFLVPWPADRSDADVKFVSMEDIKKDVVGRLPPDKKKLFDEAFAEADAMVEENIKLNQAIAPAPVEVPKISDKQADRIRDLVDQSRALLMEEIRAGRPLEKLSADERAMYEKISSIRYGGVLDKPENGINCRATEKNAYYNPATHTFAVCAGFGNLPDADLVSIIGHEMGHAIDACLGFNPVVKIDLGKYLQIRDRLKQEAQGNAERMKNLAWFDNGTLRDLTSSAPLEADDDTYNWLKRNGVVSTASNGFVKSPYGATMDCLTKSVGVRQISDDEVRGLARQLARDRSKSGTVDRAAEEKKIYDRLKRSPQCLTPAGGPSQMGESTADVWGAKVLGRYLEKNPPKSEGQRFAAIAHMAVLACMDRENKGSAEKVSTSERVGALDSHAFNYERLNAILLKDPRVQKAMGCSVKPGENCGRFLGSSSSSITESSARGSSGGSGGHK